MLSLACVQWDSEALTPICNVCRRFGYLSSRHIQPTRYEEVILSTWVGGIAVWQAKVNLVPKEGYL